MSEATTHTQLGLLIEIVERVAKEKHDGHFTVLRFASGWKAVYGTVDLGRQGVRERVQQVPESPTLNEALLLLLVKDYKP
ncbi:MAG TPA: hypothetical protein VIQ24_03625 [Pyrinomonadaceae bacterium]